MKFGPSRNCNQHWASLLNIWKCVTADCDFSRATSFVVSGDEFDPSPCGHAASLVHLFPSDTDESIHLCPTEEESSDLLHRPRRVVATGRNDSVGPSQRVFSEPNHAQQRQQDLKCVAQPSTLATHCWGGPRMGGRQSVQTDVHRRPRSNSAVEPTSVSVALTTHRNPSRSITGVGGSTALGGRVASDSASDSDEEGQAASSTLHPGTSDSIRHPPLRFSIPHLRAHRSMTHDGTTRRSVPVFQILGRLSQDIKCPVCQKTVPSDEAEIHLVMCLTRPKITYNGGCINRR
uniref:RING-type E3 ubiquitin transferase n=1 Tax=Ascaris lumbricoides TaxID=6252 RepID=A0A9J2Q606_ASCLU